MQRSLSTCVTFGVLGLAYCYAQNQEQGDTSTPTEISALQRKRIELLQERVSQIESLVKADAIGRAELIRPRMDLINACLDYAQTTDEKRKLLTNLIGEYDKLIQIAESALHKPVLPPSPGQRPTISMAASDLLWLKSERIRVQISRDILN